MGLALLAGAGLPSAAKPPEAQTSRSGPGSVPSPELVQKILAEISDITGLQLKRPVPMTSITKLEWRHWLEARVEESAKPDEIRVEQLAMQIFGLLPRDFDLRSAMVDLMTEQAAAVYDHRKKRMLFVQGSSADLMQEAVLVHELSHALADQHFDMRRFLDKGPRSDESESARLAVVEGQAMWIMMESMLRKGGQSLTKSPDLLARLDAPLRQMTAAQYPVFSKSPLSLQESLLFPYISGLRFQQAVILKLGKEGFSAVLRDPPKNTRQILHPELYLAHDEPGQVDLPELDADEWKLSAKPRRLTEGDIGELDFHVLFEQYASKAEADAAAPAWRAGRFELLEEGPKGRPMLRWAALWASPEDAARAFTLCLRAMEGKSRDLAWGDRSAAAAAGRNSYGAFRYRLSGARIEALEGLP